MTQSRPAVAGVLLWTVTAGAWVAVLAGRGGGVAGLDPLARFLLAVATVILVTHLLGLAVGRIGQPRVVGEILGGLLLGPSVLGALWPSASSWLFPASVLQTVDMAAQLGLVTFMFL